MLQLNFLEQIAGIAIGTMVVINILKFWVCKRDYERFGDIIDGLIKFKVAFKRVNDFMVFDFGEGITLWCQYTFCIRSDGLYGVDTITFIGLNGTYGSAIELSIGQSVFPVIQKMTAFEAWADTKAFEYMWDRH